METLTTRARADATTFLVVVGAVSAGVHAGLAPQHLREWLPLGASFVAAAAAAAAGVVALAFRPASLWPPRVLGAFAAGLPDLQTAEARLLRNQVDIGNAIKPYYGAAAGRKLTSLLRTHILEAVPVLAAAKAGDKVRLTQSLNAWYANANEIAAFLAKANPHNWPLAMTRTMMKQHLALTTKEAVARLQGNWTADVRAYDQVHAEILGMSHMLSTGIIRQFPSRF